MLKTIYFLACLTFLHLPSICQSNCIDKILGEAKILESNNRQLSTGTGFLVQNTGKAGLIITNKHVVGGSNAKITVYFNINNKTISREGILFHNLLNEDLALIVVDLTGLGFDKVFPFGVDLREPKLGEEVFVLGYPMPGIMGQSIKLTNGTVSSIKGIYDDENHFQISAPIQHGNSGSPIFDKRGNVIGIAYSSLVVGQNVNYGIKTKQLKGFYTKFQEPKYLKSYSLNSIQKYVTLVAVETDKIYYPELKYKEGNFNLTQPSFYDTVGVNENYCKKATINTLIKWEKEINEKTNFHKEMESILNDSYARVIYETYKLNNGWDGYNAYSKLYALLDIGAYDNIIEEVDALNISSISSDNKWYFYGTSFIPFAFAKVYKLKFEPDEKEISALLKETNEAIRLTILDLNTPPSPNENQDKINLSEFYRIVANLYQILDEKEKVVKNYQLALKFNPSVKDLSIEDYIKK